MGWYFRRAGPGGEPIGGHKLLTLFALVMLATLLVVRPVARELLGLNAAETPRYTFAAMGGVA